MGGVGNTINTPSRSIIGGGNQNTINGGVNHAITGGTNNTITAGSQNMIGAGNTNTIASGANGFIGNGGNNQINAGNQNAILNGASNTITNGNNGSILSGNNNIITTGDNSAILSGNNNTINSGDNSAILGGNNNQTTGNRAYAMGQNNNAAAGGFALGDGSTADANEYSATFDAGFLMTSTGSGNGNFVATFVNTNTGAGNSNGIAIQLGPSTPNNGNDFVQFRDGSGGVVGRIEGQTIPELPNDDEYMEYVAKLDYLVDGAIGAKTDAGIALGQNIADLALEGAAMGLEAYKTSATASCAAATLGACTEPAIAQVLEVILKVLVIASKVANVVIAGVQLGQAIQGVKDACQLRADYIQMVHDNIGVTYESGAADYAEWLPKSNLAETFLAGDIVAVKGGKITKNTDNADQYMVVSTNPMVLGNMPAKGQENGYEKVAFMGQVPVRVLGKVSLGDFILPSGKNNGFGIAMSPQSMKAADYKKIIGVAWSAGDREDLNYINVAVGLSTNALSSVIEKQAEEIRTLQLAMAKTQKEMGTMAAHLASINQALTAIASGQAPAKIESIPVKTEKHPVKTENAPAKTRTIPDPAELQMPETSTYSNATVDQHIDQALKNTVLSEEKTFSTPVENNGLLYTDELMERAYQQAKKAYANLGYDLKLNPMLQKIENNPAMKELLLKKVQNRMNGAIIDRLIQQDNK
jgi:hypothetical protein